MGPGTVFIFLFAVVFGIFYLYFSTRNKERLALIEKGADASIFMKGEQNRKAAPFWKVLILNLGLLAMGVGVGVLLGALLSYNFGYNGGYQNRPSNYIQTETFYLASVFLCAGASLLIGFNITKNLDKE
ncbi:hypothetical protein FDT66_09780 [Polaribacter aestuariivivens]|uniref:DUF6249 domain-containing protein n=1 Tax=Polaribacter aestuariivivens TaxID=2304626 RepID=A0A5S3N2B4_9FLAO|nr:DUF6249 domain-containing protein [Polaribacter aestuariivivens]TMM29405.1 hypothetical protein FDT66_09780 [Polaribacter aestuariivivens]